MGEKEPPKGGGEMEQCDFDIVIIFPYRDGHGGGIAVSSVDVVDARLDLVLDLTGACLSCGAAPGTLEGVKTDLESDDEVERVRFSSALLETFDDLGREFILAHGKVDFVEVATEATEA